MAEVPGGLKREIRRAALALAKQNAMDNKARRMDAALFVQIYGDENTEPISDGCLAGKGLWAGLYDEMIMINTPTPGVVSTQTKNLIVKPVLWPGSRSKQYMVGKGGLDFENVFETKYKVGEAGPTTGVQRFSGKSLVYEGQLVVDTVRVASAIATTRFLVNGEYPEGKDFNDMLLFVRQQCYLEFSGGLNEERLDARKDKFKSTNPADMPTKYYFTGFVAFCLFGPKPLSGRYLAIFDPDIESIGGKAIAMSTRPDANGTVQKLKKAATKTERMISKVRVGISTKEVIEAAKLEDARMASNKKALSDLLHASNEEVRNLVAEKQLLLDQVKVLNEAGMKPKAKELADKVDTLDTEIHAAKKRGRQWSDELDSERNAPPKRAYIKAMKLLDCEEPVAAADDE
jgi:hypothetical protein